MDKTTHSQSANRKPVITLRPESPGDEPLLYEVYAGTRAAELNLTGWDEATRVAFLDMQFKAMRIGYRSMFPQAEFSIILADGLPAGRIVIDRQSDRLHVVDIALLPARYGQGIGTAVMRGVLDEAAQAGKRVRLRALRDPRTLRFYQRLGFAILSEDQLDAELVWHPPKRDSPAD